MRFLDIQTLLGWRHWETSNHACPTVLIVTRNQLAPMLAHYSMRYRETQTGSTASLGKEWLKNLAQILG
jgi:hypothetical protein